MPFVSRCFHGRRRDDADLARVPPGQYVTSDFPVLSAGHDDEPLDPEHGEPARLLVPHIYFWKRAKWVRGLELREDDEPGLWEGYGYQNYGDPWQQQRYAAFDERLHAARRALRVDVAIHKRRTAFR